MKAIPSKHKKIEAADRDNIIGSALSSALSKTASVGQCPTAEQMAAFVDGGGAEADRDHILGHLAACDRCREIYLLANDLSKPDPVHQGHRGWYLACGALAAAALVILVIKLTIQQPGTSGQQVARAPASLLRVALAPPAVIKPQATSPHDSQPQSQTAPFASSLAARQLAQAATADALAASIGSPASGSYGFVGNNSRQVTAYKAGKELFELELWLAAGDKERAGLAGERLAPLLRSMGEDSAMAPLDELLRNLEAAAPSTRNDTIVNQLESLLKTSDKGIVWLGGWAAAAKLATGIGKDPYFAGNPPQRFLKELGKHLSPAAQTVLRKLDKKKATNNPEQMVELLDELANAI